jgi:septal ring factor EnvC (AmiA/AmiB activator)
MISFLITFFFSGKAKLFGVIAICGMVAYLTYSYNDMRVQVKSLKIALSEAKLGQDLLVKHLEFKEQQMKHRQEAFDFSINERIKIEAALRKTREEVKNDLKALQKEQGRFKRLLQTKGELVVRAANHATERLRKRYEEATANYN